MLAQLYKLKPCRFCGADHCTVKMFGADDNARYFGRCQLCWAAGPRATTPERAAELWNRKPVENTLHGKFD